MPMKFESGVDDTQPHSVEVRVDHHFLLPLAVEGWCYDNCGNDWNITGDDQRITLSFKEPEDQILFILSGYNQFIAK